MNNDSHCAIAFDIDDGSSENEKQMEKQFCLFAGRHGHVIDYYDSKLGEFVRVEEWDKREEKNLPPFISLAAESEGKLYVSSDTKTGGIYDECGYLMADYDTTFEELLFIAKKLGLGYRRKVLVCGRSSKGPVPCIMSNTCGEKAFSKYSQDGVERWRRKVERVFPESYPTAFGEYINFFLDEDDLKDETS